MKEVRVRYAPSPTGYLHIGNARTALFNYLYARNQGGKFIVRIEDTDIERNIEGGELSQLNNLQWLGIEWDESIDLGGEYGPYSQLERHKKNIYLPYAKKLLESGQAYKCYCTSEELDQAAEQQKKDGQIPRYSGHCSNLSEEQIKKYEDEGRSYSIRFRVPSNKNITWNDIVKNDVTFNSDDVSGDFNIMKPNGIPTYNFAVVIDDALMKISHVLRGEDHISNTPKQIMLYEALNFDIPTFCHMTLIVNETGKKLSKRDTSIVQFIEEYKNLGYLPEAMFNFISLLGWSPNSEEEIFSHDEFIKIFDVKRLSKSSAKFDVNKLTWINNQYIKKMDNDEYLSFIKPFLNEIQSNYDEKTMNEIALLYKDQISYGAEIKDVSKLFFENVSLDNEAYEFLKQDGVFNTLTTFKNQIIESEEFTPESIKSVIKSTGKEANAKGKMLFMPIRIATTGQMHGPELPNTLSVLGKERVITILDDILKEIA